jgi:hypothetical protein
MLLSQISMIPKVYPIDSVYNRFTGFHSLLISAYKMQFDKLPWQAVWLHKVA